MQTQHRVIIIISERFFIFINCLQFFHVTVVQAIFIRNLYPLISAMYVLTSNEVNYLILLDYYYEGSELHIIKLKLYRMKHKYIL